MKRILFANLVAETSGSVKSLIDIIEKIDKDKFEVFIVITRHGDLEGKLKKLAIKFFYSRLGQILNTSQTPVNFDFRSMKMMIYFLIRLPYDVYYFTRIFRKYSIDIVYINVTSLLSVGIAAKICNVPVIWQIREVFPKNYIRYFQKFIINMCSTKIITSTKLLSKEFLQIKNETIYVGITEPAHINQNIISRTKLGIDKEATVFLIYGNLTKNQLKVKGIYDFIMASKYLLKKGYLAYFIIMGITNEEVEFEIKKILENYIENFSLLERTRDVYPVINLSDVIVAAHHEAESFGRTLIEAGIKEKVVISSNIKPVDEIIIDNYNGLLFEAKNYIDLSSRMEFLLMHKNLIVEYGHNNYKVVKEKFDLVKNVKLLEKVYESI